MEVITMELQAYQEMMASIKELVSSVGNKSTIKSTGNRTSILDENAMVSNATLIEVLKIGLHILQHYRNNQLLPYKKQGGAYFYKLIDLLNLIQRKLISCTPEQLEELINKSVSCILWK